MRSGVTLLELLVVLIIVSILATLAVTIYSGLERNAQAAKARHALSIIAGAEKIYHSDNGAYTNDLAVLNTTTGIDLTSVTSDTSWTYTVSGSVATATKEGNPCNGGTITLNFNTGVFTPAGGIGGCP
jgi:prepilin-type N-terminal cleavage/methylation domain-containing protein